MSFWDIVKRVIGKADIVLLVLDARFINKTRHPELEQKVLQYDKKLLYVINKADLVSREELARISLRPMIYVSATSRLGTTRLMKKILEISHGEKCTVAVVGYPNVGKSSVINALKGKSAAKASSISGYTRGVQKVRVHSKIMLLDSPGVLPYKEDHDTKHATIATVDANKVKDPDLVVCELLEEYEGIEQHYGVEPWDGNEDSELVLERIAQRLGKKKKGGELDLETTSRMILRDWQTGKIHQQHNDEY